MDHSTPTYTAAAAQELQAQRRAAEDIHGTVDADLSPIELLAIAALLVFAAIGVCAAVLFGYSLLVYP
jgi:hypothetical protein